MAQEKRRIGKTFSQRCAKTRKRRNLDVTALAKELGVTPAAVRSWESSGATSREPRLGMLCKIARALDCNPLDFVDEFNDEPELDLFIDTLVRELNTSTRQLRLGLLGRLQDEMRRWSESRGETVEYSVIPFAGQEVRGYAPEKIVDQLERTLREVSGNNMTSVVVVAPDAEGAVKQELCRVPELGKVECVVQRSPMGVLHAIQLAVEGTRQLNEKKPFCVVFPDDILETAGRTHGKSCSELLREMIEISQRYNCSVVGLEELGPNNKDLEKYGIAACRCDAGDEVWWIERVHEKPGTRPQLERGDSAPSGMALKRVKGGYVFTRDIHTILPATLENERTGRRELADAINILLTNRRIAGIVTGGRGDASQTRSVRGAQRKSDSGLSSD